jgi:vancomycin resistance protein YoaR
LIVIAAGAFAAGALLDLWYRGEALPGVNVEGVAVGGMTPVEVADVVSRRASDLIADAVTFTHEGREWRASAAEAGVRVNSTAMGADAVELGRTLPWPLSWLSSLATPLRQPAVPFRASVDRNVLATYLERIAVGIDRPAVEPVISVKNGLPSVVPGIPGNRLDVPTTAQAVRVPVSSSARQSVALTIVEVPPRITTASVAEAQRVAQRILASPLLVRAGDKSWTLSVTQLESMIEFRRESGAEADRLIAGLSEASVMSFVRTVAQQADRTPQDGQVRWDGKALTLSKDGIDGLQVDQTAGVRAIIDGATRDIREIPLPVRVAPAPVSAARLASLGIKDLVGTGSSRYAGSAPERANNVKVAAMKLNHQFVAPGATFSFLEALGPITKDEGYLEGLTIQGDATVPGIGGGICQVSTTLFRAAFHAGLPIIERHQHVYRVAYYEQDGSPVGFDAAVYDPGLDFRFRNDTGSPLLLHVSIDSASATLIFRLFGETTGREVKFSASRANEKPAPPPATDVADPKLDFGVRKQVEWKAMGVDATIRRAVIINGKPGANDTFVSRYVPWQEKWSIGTGAVTAKTPSSVKTAIAQGTVSPGTPGAIVALRLLLTPTLPPDAPDSPATAAPAPAVQVGQGMAPLAQTAPAVAAPAVPVTQAPAVPTTTRP